MSTFNASDAYWNIAGVGVWGSARGGAVSTPNTDAPYQAWLVVNGAPIPVASSAALDATLAYYGLPATGLTFAGLAPALIAACASAAAAVLSQIYTDPVHQAAGQNAAMIVAGAGGAPASGSPFYAQFNAYAALFGITPAQLATLAIALTNQSFALSVALSSLAAAAASAANSAALASALAAFETAIGAVVTAVNAASPPTPIVAPPAITIKGVNA